MRQTLWLSEIGERGPIAKGRFFESLRLGCANGLRRKEGFLFALYGTTESRALTLVWQVDAVSRCRRMRGAPCRESTEKWDVRSWEIKTYRG
jgi:hypothetical protein